jgi:hypothetical protein
MRSGTYIGYQDLPMPDAWVKFDDKGLTEPINPLNLIAFPALESDIKAGDEVKANDFDDIYKVIHVEEGQAQVRRLDSPNPDNNPVERQLPVWHLTKVESEPSDTKVEEITEVEAPEEKAPEEKAPVALQIPNDIDGAALSKEEVEELIERIIDNGEALKNFALFAKNFTRYALVKIDAREGYKAFGCDSMSAFLENHHSLFKRAYSSLQKEWQAGKLEHSMGLKIGTLPETQARELYPLRDNIHDCKKAWELACEVAESENRRVKAADIGAAVREIAQLPEPPKKIRTKCGWVAGPNAARHYKVSLHGQEVNLHDTYDSTARTIIDLAEARKQAPEELIIQGLLGKLGEVLGVGNPGVVAAAISFLQKEAA